MKPYCVIRFDNASAINLRYANPKRGTIETGLLWAQPQVVSDPYNDGTDNSKQQLVFVDTEDDAKNYASIMSAKYPQYHYITAKCSDVYKSSPGPITRSQFTKDGLIPL